MTCSSGCPTKDHSSWGECIRAKGVRIDPHGIDASAERKAARERQRYRDVRRQGIQPETSKPQDVNAALEISERTGKAYRAA